MVVNVFLFGPRHLELSKDTLNTMQEGSIGFVQYALQANKLPAVFQALPSSMQTAIGAAHPLLPATIFIGVEVVVLNMSNTDVTSVKALPTPSHPPYMAVAVPVCKRARSSTITRSRMKCRRNTPIKPTMAVVKDKNGVDLSEAVELSNLSSETEAAQVLLLQAIQTVFCVYAEGFRNLRKTYELYGDEDMRESVDLFLCNPPYIVHRQNEFKTATETISTLTTYTRSLILRNTFRRVKGIDISSFHPYSLLPGAGVSESDGRS